VSEFFQFHIAGRPTPAPKKLSTELVHNYVEKWVMEGERRNCSKGLHQGAQVLANWVHRLCADVNCRRHKEHESMIDHELASSRHGKPALYKTDVELRASNLESVKLRQWTRSAAAIGSSKRGMREEAIS
jgi:hypothetical protein